MEGLILLMEEILHQFEVGSLSHCFWNFVCIQYQVVQSDFFHQLCLMGSHEGLWDTMGFSMGVSDVFPNKMFPE